MNFSLRCCPLGQGVRICRCSLFANICSYKDSAFTQSHRLLINPRTAKMQIILWSFYNIYRANKLLFCRAYWLYKSIFAYFVKSRLPYLCTPTATLFSSARVSQSLTDCRKILFRQSETLPLRRIKMNICPNR